MPGIDSAVYAWYRQYYLCLSIVFLWFANASGKPKQQKTLGLLHTNHLIPPKNV